MVVAKFLIVGVGTTHMYGEEARIIHVVMDLSLNSCLA